MGNFWAILLYVTTTTFQVKTEAFEGPLELLLELIERHKLHISEVSLAQVADDYISHLEGHHEFPIRDTAHFILIASTLLLIKSRSLLPTLELTSEEEANIHDLEERLRLYQRVRALSQTVNRFFGSSLLFPREGGHTQEPVFTPDESISVANLHEAAKRILNALPQPEKLSQVVVDKVMSLEEMIENLAHRIKASMKMNFKEFAQSSTGSKEEKVTIVVSFLAMLELVKQGMIAVQQHELFDDIEMETQETGVPDYS